MTTMRKRYDIFDPREYINKNDELRKIDQDIYNLEIMIENTPEGNPLRQECINRLFAKRRERNRLVKVFGRNSCVIFFNAGNRPDFPSIVYVPCLYVMQRR